MIDCILYLFRLSYLRFKSFHMTNDHASNWVIATIDSFLHPEWNSDVKESLFLVFGKTKIWESSPKVVVDSWRRLPIDFYAKVIYPLFMKWASLNKRRIDYLSI